MRPDNLSTKLLLLACKQKKNVILWRNIFVMEENRNFITLFELNTQVKRTLMVEMGQEYWVRVEIGEINEHYNGHCYLDLIENDTTGKRLIAKARATIWSYNYRTMKPYFEQLTGQKLAVGMKLLIKVKVVFHELYSFSLNVVDIDPTYTLGDLERLKQEIIKKLTQEGVIDMNKDHVLPVLPQRLAIISSETAAGYGDFCDQIFNNPRGYRYSITLFNAVMQGDASEDSIVDSLEQISNSLEMFDVVVIIRGGGAKMDLKCFDSYELCSNIAQFPLPVVTGIGHERDSSIADMVAHTALKTPTAVAEFFISCFAKADEQICSLQLRFTDVVNNIIVKEKLKINSLADRFVPVVQKYIVSQTGKLDIYPQLLKRTVDLLFQNHKNRVEKLQLKAEYLDPKKMLNRGYAIIKNADGKVLKGVDSLKIGESVDITLRDGVVESTVTSLKKVL